MKLDLRKSLCFLIICLFLTSSQAFSKERNIDSFMRSLHWISPPIKVKKDSILNIQGGDFSITGFKDTILIVNFWATWCIPCQKELPSLIKMQQALKFNPLRIITINSGETLKVAKTFLEKRHLFSAKDSRLTMGYDPTGKLLKAYDVSIFPTTFVIDKDRNLILRIKGKLDWNRREVITFFKNLSE